MDIDDGGTGAVNEGVIFVTDGGGGSRDGGGLAPASWRLGGAVGSVPDGSGAAVLEAGNPIRRVSRLPDPGCEKTSMKRFFVSGFTTWTVPGLYEKRGGSFQALSKLPGAKG